MDALRPPQVLVVDDFPQVRQVFGRFLRQGGMEPRFADDGVAALAAARLSRPDLVLCDLEMPRMDGVALCLALRADEATRRVPILVVTASGGPAAQAALAAGCDAVLSKPCSRELLMTTIRDLLARVERGRTAAATTTPPPPPDELP
jgi:CheY-like chemotaxis protein